MVPRLSEVITDQMTHDQENLSLSGEWSFFCGSCLDILFFLVSFYLGSRFFRMSSSQDPDQDKMEEKTTQPGFIRSVLQVFSGSRLRTPESPKDFDYERDSIRRGETRQNDQTRMPELTTDEVELRKEMNDALSQGFRYDESLSPSIKANGEPSSGFRYFGNEGKTGQTVGVSQGKGLMSSLESPVRVEEKGNVFSSDPSSFPLSRPVAGYAARNAEPDCHPYFYHPPTAPVGSAGRGAGESVSIRVGGQSVHNITQRDAKRPKERSRDKAYKQRFSMVSAGDMAEHRPSFAFQAKPGGLHGNVDHGTTPEPSGFIPGSEQRSSQVQLATGGQSPPTGPFVIYLTYAGARVAHRVWDSMGISQLIDEAGLVFGIDPSEVTLMLFSMTPTSLHRGAKISGPPRVTAGSTVMVFQLPIARSTAPYPGRPVDPSPLPPLSTKLLASFKLPKFDGVARSWKQWEKAFVRFLGIHQLDHVLEENFLDTMWTVPGATAANKMVYFLVEDAVATGTLASRLIRQATQWNGHEAFVLLRNGYVFNGPQTATILLAELSKIRLKRDEDASSFCLRLVELIEDLELIPGDAAVYLTDTQKLGYLLSAIRHESSLQAVYSQLQSEQLRGTVTFDQACRELHHRVESMRADDYLDSRSGRALLSTEGKKKGQGGVELQKLACLAKDCAELVQPYLPLCKLCYLQCMAGKISTLPLRDNLGNAVFNSRTKMLDFPPAVPPSRFPKKGMKKGKKVMLVCHEHVKADLASTVN